MCVYVYVCMFICIFHLDGVIPSILRIQFSFHVEDLVAFHLAYVVDY